MNLMMSSNLFGRDHFVPVRVDERTFNLEFGDLGRHQAELGEVDSLARVVRPAGRL